MGARTKLNQAHVTGAVMTASIVGLIFQSWWAFWLVVILCLADSAFSGGIRGNRNHHRP